jgi:hypothetical protein
MKSWLLTSVPICFSQFIVSLFFTNCPFGPVLLCHLGLLCSLWRLSNHYWYSWVCIVLLSKWFQFIVLFWLLVCVSRFPLASKSLFLPRTLDSENVPSSCSLQQVSLPLTPVLCSSITQASTVQALLPCHSAYRCFCLVSKITGHNNVAGSHQTIFDVQFQCNKYLWNTYEL